MNSLQRVLGISHSGVSQNLSVLRAHRLVEERREGRRVIYSLRQNELAEWLRGGLLFLEGDLTHSEEMREALERVKRKWSDQEEESTSL